MILRIRLDKTDMTEIILDTGRYSDNSSHHNYSTKFAFWIKFNS